MAGYGPALRAFNKRFARNRAIAARPPYAKGYPAPPVGTYDPSIDAQARQAQTGYQDLTTDTGLQKTYLSNDFVDSQNQIQQQQGNSLADLLRNYNRSSEDLGVQRDQANTNHARALQDLSQSRDNVGLKYTRLANSQLQGANAAGVLGGGAMAQASQKRAFNQGLDLQPINTAQQREGQDYQTTLADLLRTQGRVQQDYGTGVDRTNTAATHDLQRGAVTYGRNVNQLDTTLARGGRDLTNYQQELIPLRFWSAAGLQQYTPPAKVRKRYGIR